MQKENMQEMSFKLKIISFLKYMIYIILFFNTLDLFIFFSGTRLIFIDFWGEKVTLSLILFVFTFFYILIMLIILANNNKKSKIFRIFLILFILIFISALKIHYEMIKSVRICSHKIISNDISDLKLLLLNKNVESFQVDYDSDIVKENFLQFQKEYEPNLVKILHCTHGYGCIFIVQPKKREPFMIHRSKKGIFYISYLNYHKILKSFKKPWVKLKSLKYYEDVDC